MIVIIAVLAGIGLIAFAVFKQMRGGTLMAQQQASMTENTKAAIKISAAGAIFLFLLWILIPEFIGRHHKEIAVIVIAMIVGAVVLGITETDWTKNSIRKILRAHYIALTVILILVVIFNDSEIKKSLASSPPTPTKTSAATALVDYPLCAGPEKYENLKNGATQIIVPLNPRCWSGWVIMPNYKFKFRFSSPKELEFKFLEGKRVLFNAADPPMVIGDIGNSYFQLRGDGEAIITIEKI